MSGTVRGRSGRGKRQTKGRGKESNQLGQGQRPAEGPTTTPLCSRTPHPQDRTPPPPTPHHTPLRAAAGRGSSGASPRGGWRGARAAAGTPRTFAACPRGTCTAAASVAAVAAVAAAAVGLRQQCDGSRTQGVEGGSVAVTTMRSRAACCCRVQQDASTSLCLPCTHCSTPLAPPTPGNPHPPTPPPSHTPAC